MKPRFVPHRSLLGRLSAPRWTGIAALAAALALSPGAEASLSPPPYDFAVSPSTVVQGERLTLRLTPRAEVEPEGPYDIHVWFLADGGKSWSYLSPAGRWSRKAVPYREVRDRAAFGPVTIVTDGELPAGWYTLGVQLIAPGAPPVRKYYAFQPLVARARVRPGGLDAAPRVGAVAGLAMLTLLAVVVVWSSPFRRAGR
jgi:hypothetical protein